MSAKYQATYTIPEGYPALLKGLTREILRAQPDNIYDFCARYFVEAQAKGSGMDTANVQDQSPGDSKHEGLGQPQSQEQIEAVRTAAHQLDLTHLTAAELEPLILKLFVTADQDHNGYLDRSEFAQVLQSTQLKLDARTIRQVMAEADEDEDNRIQYKEFLPAMVDLLQSIKAVDQAASLRMEQGDRFSADEQEMLLHGLAKEELEALMLKVFQKHDGDGCGVLFRRDFKAALRSPELGLTRRDINSILTHVDTAGSGNVLYRDFIPVCFKILVERFKDERIIDDALSNQDGLQGVLLRTLQAADGDSMGALSLPMVHQVLKDLSYKILGLSTLQIVTLLAQAPQTPDGLVQYVQFVPLAANMIYSMYDADSMKLRLQAIKSAAEAGGIRALRNLDMEGLRALLEQAFMQADTHSTGQLSPPQVQDVLGALGAGAMPQLSGAHLRAMFAAIDTDESGTVDWNELVGFVCDTVEHIEREQYIQSLAEEQASASPGQAARPEGQTEEGQEEEQSYADGEEEDDGDYGGTGEAQEFDRQQE